MTHHITDEQIGQIAEQVGLVGPASRVGDCHAASLRFARAVLALAAPAPAVPSEWRITDSGDGTITVQGPGMGCIVSDVEAVERRVPGEVLHALCRAMLTASPAAEPQRREGQL